MSEWSDGKVHTLPRLTCQTLLNPKGNWLLGFLLLRKRGTLYLYLPYLFIYLDFASLVEDSTLLIRLELSEFWRGLYWKGSLPDIILEFKAVAPHFLDLLCFLASVATPWTLARQTPLSMGFSRQEYCSGLPCLPPGDLPNTGIVFCVSCIAGGFFTAEPPGLPFWGWSHSLKYKSFWRHTKRAWESENRTHIESQ